MPSVLQTMRKLYIKSEVTYVVYIYKEPLLRAYHLVSVIPILRVSIFKSSSCFKQLLFALHLPPLLLLQALLNLTANKKRKLRFGLLCVLCESMDKADYCNFQWNNFNMRFFPHVSGNNEASGDCLGKNGLQQSRRTRKLMSNNWCSCHHESTRTISCEKLSQRWNTYYSRF